MDVGTCKSTFNFKYELYNGISDIKSLSQILTDPLKRLYARSITLRPTRFPMLNGNFPSTAAKFVALYFGIEGEQQLSIIKKRIVIKNVISVGSFPCNLFAMTRSFRARNNKYLNGIIYSSNRTSIESIE